MKKMALAVILSLFILLSTGGACLAEFDTQQAGFAIQFCDEIYPYTVMGVFVLPGQVIELRETEGNAIICESLTGKARFKEVDEHVWTFKSPKTKGLFPLRIIRPETGMQMTLNLFVMVPFSSVKNEYLNGYRIGTYPDADTKKMPICDRPAGFVEVTADNCDTLVSPHFRLGQFLCKQDGEFPKYMVLRGLLLLKLEAILEEINNQGVAASSFHIMSGYRTPYYNAAIGNVKYSRHVWGEAADIFIDEDTDNIMDDLNGDRDINGMDARVLYDIVDDLYDKSWYAQFIGGLGNYRQTSYHGPFVHVDVRGFRARWAN